MERPPSGWVLLNTDGASKGNSGTAASGVVVRGDRGEWVEGFCENFGICTSVKALKAVLWGLKMVHSLGLKKAWVQVDSMIIVGTQKGLGAGRFNDHSRDVTWTRIFEYYSQASDSKVQRDHSSRRLGGKSVSLLLKSKPSSG